MTALPSDALADLYKLVAELEQQLESSFAAHDDAIARQAATNAENVRLQNELLQRTSDLNESLHQQTATAEVLRAIASSPADVESALNAIVESACALCDAYDANVLLRIGDHLHFSAHHGPIPTGQHSHPINRQWVTGRSVVDKTPVQVSDFRAPEAADFPEGQRQSREQGHRCTLSVPLLREGEAIGAIALRRLEPVAFTERQIALLQSFADQAVIAIENARLFNETREALDRQTATSEILKVIASSPSDVQPVFEAIAASAKRLLGGFSTTVLRFIGDELHLVAYTPTDPAADETLRTSFPRLLAEFPTFALVRNGETVQFADTESDDVPQPNKELARLRGFRSVLFTPLMNQGTPVGMISVTRAEPGVFASHHVQLLQTFADQAVIAIENARLFNETKEALEQQKASAAILRVVSNSVADAQPVFDEILHSIEHLFGGDDRFIYLAGADGLLHIGAAHGANAERVRALYPVPLEGTASEVAFRERRLIRYADVFNDPEVPSGLREVARRIGQNYSMALAPMLWEDRAIGSIFVGRTSMKPFNEKECSLLCSFADQAVIAIQNARLFNETREALERQTATADILKVIASSPSDTTPVFEAIAHSAKRLLGGFSAAVFRYVDGFVHLAAFTPTKPAADQALRADFPTPVEDFAAFRLAQRGEPFPIPDTELVSHTPVRDIARVHGFRSMLWVPMVHGGVTIGTISVTRLEPGAFAPHHTQLLQTFADQAVIAIENARLFNETREALEQQKASADILRTISSSVADAQPAFDKILDSCKHLFGSDETAVLLVDDENIVTLGAYVGRQRDAVAATFPAPADKSPAGQAIRERRVVHYTDAANDARLTRAVRHVAQLAGYEAMAYAPMMWNERGIGAIGVSRLKGAFRDKELALLQTFADQAVIAIQNARLFNETREALERQTATAEILNVIASSPSDVRPVFEAIVDSTKRLLGGFSAAVFRFIDGIAYLEAITPTTPAADEIMRNSFPRPVADFQTFAMVQGGRIVQVPDTDALSDDIRDIARGRGFRSMLLAPLMSSGTPIGLVSVTRVQTGTFAVHHEQLLRTFADQAVIAIENVRLFDEVRQRTEDLSESLQQQTAVGDVLKTISRSTFDLQPVLDTLVNTAALLCDAEMAFIMRREGDEYRAGAAVGYSREYIEFLETHPLRVDRGSITGRAVLEQQTIQILDVATDPEYTLRESTTLGHQHTTLCVPLLRENEPIGTIVLARQRVEAFTQKQIDLVTTFADQAVIAIENVRLFDEVRERTDDLGESLQQQTATADVLKVISRSAFDLQAVLDTLTESAARLCGADMAAIARQDARGFYHATNYNFSVDWVKLVDPLRLQPERGSLIGRVLLAGAAVQIPDVLADPEYAYFDMQKAAGYRTLLGVPLLRGKQPIGVLFLGHKTVQPFTEKQIDLVSTFADQAVIAIENVRLFDEVQAKTRDLSEALTYQTGSANILKVIASSPTDINPVLQAIVESACELCDAYDAIVRLKQGDNLRFSAHHGPLSVTLMDWPISRNWTAGRAVIDRKPVQIKDLLSPEGDEFPEAKKLGQEKGQRTILSVPLLRDGDSLGVITLRRLEVNPFEEKQIALLQTFADQAVIAIGNVRLFEEVQAKTHDLSEALTYQTGSGNILRVIASSPTDVKPVLTAIVESACELCDADDALATLRDGDELVFQAQHGSIPVVWQRQPIDREGAAGLAVIERAPVHVHDLLAPEGEQFPRAREFARTTNVRTVLCVPLLREGESIGAIVLRRTEVRPFSDKQISLLQTFADQAVIAIGNVRLFEEVQQRTRELSESLEQQTATSEVLSVISRSAGDLEPVFQSMLENATRICGAQFGLMNLYDGDSFHTVGFHNVPPEFEAAGKQSFRARPDGDLGQMVQTKKVVHIHDLRTRPLYLEGDPATVQLADLAGARTILIVPMVKDDEFVGTIGIYRLEVSPFNEKQIALLSSFASQAVIAIENTRLLKELRERTNDLTRSLDDLRTAQDRLVQTEKLASLGQLTAGIAHEIKNPLNFVNNFAALSAELTDELNDVLKPAEISDKIRGEVDELTGLLKDNLQKVVQHGQRANSIVKNMLLHSREGSGDHRPADINALIDESFNLAYHGARAERPDFNVTLQRDFDANAGMVEVFPQEITRVFLNLVSNGFYAVNKRRIEGGQTEYDPVLSVATRNLGDTVEIRIRDNGTGIPPEVKDKMFNPFFTTKPAGEGTGLGLSMSHDIIVKQHGGTIDVDTAPGQFTEFRIVLPRTSNPPNKTRG